MAKHLSEVDVAAIVESLRLWEGPLGWEQLCDEVSKFVGKRPTRQSLASFVEIKKAYAFAKTKAKDETIPSPLPSSLKIAGDRISRLEVEVEVLKRENSALLERFIRWQYNATNAGLHESQLDRALPKIDRERSDAYDRPKIVKSKR